MSESIEQRGARVLEYRVVHAESGEVEVGNFRTAREAQNDIDDSADYPEEWAVEKVTVTRVKEPWRESEPAS